MPAASEIGPQRSALLATAVVAAAGRSIDTHRADALIEDRYAEALVAAARPEPPVPTRPSTDPTDATWRALSDLLGVRSRFFDDVLARAAANGTRQIVLVAAGLDTRAFRLPWPPQTTVFELDYGSTLEFKQEVLQNLGAATTCVRKSVAHDLQGDWSTALLAHGFQPRQPTAWVAEGLLYYLTSAAQSAVLTTVDQLSAVGSRCAVEDDPHFVRRMTADDEARTRAHAMGLDLEGLLEKGPRPDPASWLHDHGWLVDRQELRAVAASYGRTLGTLADRINGSFQLIEGRKGEAAQLSSPAAAGRRT